ncbi:MAG: hypothetical protein WB714_24070, partial [Candidatus Sulfotelmatobacter sp.]
MMRACQSSPFPVIRQYLRKRNDLEDLYLDRLNQNHLTRNLVPSTGTFGLLSDIGTSANRG